MNRIRVLKTVAACLAYTLTVIIQPEEVVAQGRPLTLVDLMKFRQIRSATISPDGNWIAFQAQPDRGDGSVIVRSTGRDTRFEIQFGSRPVISSDSRWVAMRLEPSFVETETAGQDDKPKPGLGALNLRTGETRRFAEVDTFALSADGRWLARLHARPVAEADSLDGEAADSIDTDNAGRQLGGLLVLHSFESGAELEVPDVARFSFADDTTLVAYAVSSEDSTRDGLYLRDLRAQASPETVLDQRSNGVYTELVWSKPPARMAFLSAQAGSDGETGPASLSVWSGDDVEEIVHEPAIPAGWMIPSKNALRWSKDRARLFFGLRPAAKQDEASEADTSVAPDPYDTEAILEDKEVDVWHWNDPRINPQQKKVWKDEQKRTYLAVYHLSSGRTTPLSDLEVLGVEQPENEATMLARAHAPYFKEVTWDGSYYDLFTIDMLTGAKTLIASRLSNTSTLSPGGRFAVFYEHPHWYVADTETGSVRNATDGLGVPFSDEDHDYPALAPGYGVGGWVGMDEGVLINDKYDVWHVPLGGSSAPVSITAGRGRAENRTFRAISTDPDKPYHQAGDRLLLSSYHNKDKRSGFYTATIGNPGVSRLVEAAKKFTFLAKAKEADVYLYTREAYDEFPDLWVSDAAFRRPKKITSLNTQIDPFAWGAAELVEWTSADGVPLQGVLIKPGNYKAGRRYPVIVYFYRFFSQRLHEFNEPVVNHRPSFPFYASNGYAVFLPDIRFEIGRPGFSATKAIVPGVQKLIDMGVADPKAIGLHGHSWSGYQTAFIVTQTNMFAAAVAGAPVSNMTSAYGGIRWESGLARQFQYEKSQSRLGGSLWEARDRYIDNSPLFFADRIQTPLLLMFGDDDGAVPWYQGIELYLALRRLGKDAIFLQYRGEPHHLKKYPNKLDYSIKMKEYFDHYLKGAPAPEWIREGVPYGGE